MANGKASIAVMAKLAEELSGNKKVAFAFCDRAATTYEGYKLLAQNLPGPGAVFQRLIADAGMLWLNAKVTLAEIVLGFALTVVTAIPPRRCTSAGSRTGSCTRRRRLAEARRRRPVALCSSCTSGGASPAGQ